MIEKPKRPKQPNIQDRQPPRTLEELINRYDLDNTKVYDFLDELVELLNTEKKSIDTSINDLNNKKVTKSGDTMTGDLDIQGNAIRFGTTGNIFWKEDGYGDKFRVIPNFGNSGENNKLIIQSTTGGAGEDPQNWKDLVYIHADTGFIELAGRLLFNNKDSYDAIRKIRTLNGTDYQLTVGVGGNGSARMEYVSNDNVLGSIEVRSNGLYNGVSGKKLAEQSTGWTNVSLTSYLRGTARYVRIGNIVIVNFNEVNINQNITQHATVLATGLPKASIGGLSLLTNFDTGKYLRILITDAGNIQNHWSNANASNNVWYGTLIYVTNE